ncbi:MAG: hypothetical protein KDE00_03575 [Rhodobacteraceae bacterium]|nr:hypothetical protein [Paracoccaceae bacterium]
MKQTASFFALAVALAACTAEPKGMRAPTGVREAAASEVGACAYVSDFRIKPSVYGLLAEEGLRFARNTILTDARDAGANAVVFDPMSPGTQVYELHAVAYRC